MKDFKFRNNTFLDVIKKIYPNQAEFKCTPDSEFLESLDNAGYDEWRRISTQETVRKADKGGKCSGLTSCTSTGRIYIEEFDCYYIIDIDRIESGIFGVKMWFAPQEFKQDEID